MKEIAKPEELDFVFSLHVKIPTFVFEPSFILKTTTILSKKIALVNQIIGSDTIHAKEGQPLRVEIFTIRTKRLATDYRKKHCNRALGLPKNRQARLDTAQTGDTPKGEDSFWKIIGPSSFSFHVDAPPRRCSLKTSPVIGRGTSENMRIPIRRASLIAPKSDGEDRMRSLLPKHLSQ